MKIVRSSALPNRTAGLWESADRKWMFIRATEDHWIIAPIAEPGSKEMEERQHFLASLGLANSFKRRSDAVRSLSLALGDKIVGEEVEDEAN
jgi:hypothetical protein